MKFKVLMFVLVLSFLSGACATRNGGRPGIPIGFGLTLGVESNSVVVTNATTLTGQVFLNGRPVRELPVGVPEEIFLGAQVRSNVLTFRIFDQNPAGERILVGIATRTFRGGAGNRYEWTIRSVQPIR